MLVISKSWWDTIKVSTKNCNDRTPETHPDTAAALVCPCHLVALCVSQRDTIQLNLATNNIFHNLPSIFNGCFRQRLYRLQEQSFLCETIALIVILRITSNLLSKFPFRPFLLFPKHYSRRLYLRVSSQNHWVHQRCVFTHFLSRNVVLNVAGSATTVYCL
ncbi:uncharacterized protein PHALS_14781 [Plasmopara halstedii]|uniref:Uncharacterized protein n=1 Tax=Plasmopara halstedii TaxID=4781 RepID=A0A0P1ASC1_PLAHL|nr:uncharacterized protein PHALS_14781 [Plasmopara halstedii]CEG44153.1 hypothetical protein PHALS_14781 [Plasmopara halstedii]|eukprot:XP_024580522.1 hypothetical protein PHALS_14781 [Plasmopara halstedii]